MDNVYWIIFVQLNMLFYYYPFFLLHIELKYKYNVCFCLFL